MNPLQLFNQTNFSNSTWWQLKADVKGYRDEIGYDLVTEIAKNRIFRFLELNLKKINLKGKSRYLVQLFDDGYICWIDINGLEIDQFDDFHHKIVKCDEIFIKNKIPEIIDWILSQSKKVNFYKWGGTLGPNFDCSGLIQTAFMIHGINIPRDSYQIRNFCKHLFHFPGFVEDLKEGDLLFFGEKHKCNHVAIYINDGQFAHSSGIEHGRNGIGFDSIYESINDDTISKYYRSRLLSAGRVFRAYQWNKSIR